MTPGRFVDAGRRYRLESRIATGGMGEVWRATDVALGRPVAVKLLKSEYADDATFRSRFASEARHAAALHHPGVAAVFDVGEGDAGDGSGQPVPFLVMELVEGQPLSMLLRGGRRLDAGPMRDLLAQAADAIGAAHRAGIVHRDVKPANLLVTPDRRVKITDFGIARASDGLGLTGTGQVMGTPQYLSPEQARGYPATPASDVYSLGVVAWECLAGYRPFDKESAVATALAQLNDPVPPLPDDVPGDLALVVERALAKDPAQRFADGDALAVALRDPATAATQVVRSASPPVVPPPAVVPADATRVMPAAGPPTTATRVTSPRVPPPPADLEQPVDTRSGPDPWAVALGVALAVAAVVLVVVLLTRGGDDTGDTPVAVDPGTSATPTPSETPTPTEEPSETEAPTITLDEDDYVGRDIDDVNDDLRDQELRPDPEVVENPGDETPGEVISLNPTDDLSPGDTVTVRYWGEAPEEEPTTPEPSSTPAAPSTSTAPTGAATQSDGGATTAPTDDSGDSGGLLGGGL